MKRSIRQSTPFFRSNVVIRQERSGGISKATAWSTRANDRSPRYTTRISDLMEASA
ncbi:DUF4113 domain-containing protein [uncultured Brevundimonas sp.]|uniref:DUF4113 domain-containing protein n=1 Tax=uncultured Brevundimonas sp. TaxID=213418 RepID=UPI00345CD3F8